MTDFLLGLFVCLFVCFPFVCCLSVSLLTLVRFGHQITLLRYADKRIVNTSAVPVRICQLNGYWSRVHSFEYKS